MNGVNRHINSFPKEIQEVLYKIRALILKKVPEAYEIISYGMLAYKLYGKSIVYFAGYKNHIGFYATPKGNKEFEEELSKFKQGKGSVQFLLNQPMPFQLIERMVEFKVNENLKTKPKTKKNFSQKNLAQSPNMAKDINDANSI
jgi:uncharacterized protein YdhG (YjbR/CyaY superfamily)